MLRRLLLAIAAALAVIVTWSWLDDAAVVAPAPLATISTPVRTGRAIPGAVVPDLPLIDQDGAETAVRDAKGRVRVVTFLYTRCPMPELCPLVVKHLETVRQRVNEAGFGSRIGLLGVSLEPEVDTPAILRGYGEAVLAPAGRFEQWTLATGTAAQIEEAANFFGVGYRSDAGFIVHTLSTAVIGHDGRVVRVFPSNSWQPEDLYGVVRAAVQRAAVH